MLFKYIVSAAEAIYILGFNAFVDLHALKTLYQQQRLFNDEFYERLIIST
jgi:hypothetical protein